MKLIEKEQADNILADAILVTNHEYAGDVYELDGVQYLVTEDGNLYEIDTEDVENVEESVIVDAIS